MANFNEYTGSIVLIILSYLVPLLFSAIRNNKKYLTAFYVVTTALHFVSLFNYAVFTLPGADLDPTTFSNNALGAVARGSGPMLSVGTGAYEYILYISYVIFGGNKLVGQSLSILVSVTSCMFLLRIACHLNIKGNFSILVLLIAGFTPSFLFYMSLTFREVFQLFGLIGGIYFAYESFSKNSLVSLLISSAFFVFMGFFHHVLLGLSFILIAITLVFFFLHSGSSKEKIIKNIMLAFIGISVIGYIVGVNIPAGEGNDYIRILKESGSVTKMVDRYRDAVEKNLPRSTYGFKVDTSSPISAGYGLILSYFNYLYGPSVLNISKPIDVVPAVNALMRLLVSLFFIYLLIKKFQIPKGLIYLLVVYFVVTTMWSLGTTNYGQAFRHNSITDWILAIVLVIGIKAVFYKEKIK
jgi:hypothetical protein